MPSPRLRRWRRWIGAGATIGLGALLLQPVDAQAGSSGVLKADLEGDINTVTAAYIGQAVKRAESERKDAMVLVMNTPGGDSNSMDAILTTLLNSRVPVIAFVYPAGARADSAGLFVAQAADVVAMAPGTNMGSAHPILASGADIPGDLGKKVLNDAVTRIRNLATVHGRNADWCEQAVRESVNVNADQALSLHVADLEARDLPTLLNAVDSHALHRPDGGQARLQLAGASVEEYPMTPIQQALHAVIDPNIAFLFLLLASFGVLVELSTPGAVLPGVVGVISAILALVALTNLPINLAGVLLILFALGLFIGDIKAPTHGILTAGAVVAMLLGSALLVNTGPIGLGVSPLLIVGGAAASLGLFGFVLRKAIAARSRPAFMGVETLVGAVGQVREPLAPLGRVFVDGALWRAASVGGPIPMGTQVKVVARHGFELEVVPVETTSNVAAGGPEPSGSREGAV
jgi:membrane-bound serine protease (ClpP class)